MLSVMQWGWGGNEDPVAGTNEDGGRFDSMGINSWEMRGVGGNEVPVEGRNRCIVNGESYCDDRILVRYDQMDRLCVMIRVLTVLLTMELVILGLGMSAPCMTYYSVCYLEEYHMKCLKGKGLSVGPHQMVGSMRLDLTVVVMAM